MIIACLNFFNELPALKASISTYYNKVDKIIAIDGAYKGYPASEPYSTDGSIEYLERLSKVKLIKTKTFWKDQCVKRSRYFKEGKRGDLFFIIDADEFVVTFPDLTGFNSDVGHVEFVSPLYQKPYTEPRIFQYREGLKYKSRHHYIYDQSGLIATHREVGSGISSANIGIKILHRRGFGKNREQKAAKQEFKKHQNGIEGIGLHEKDIQPVQIAMFTSYDPAGIAWNLSEAINTTTPNNVDYFRQTNNYIDYEEKYNTSRNISLAIETIGLSEVIHCHQSLNYADVITTNPAAKYVIHHHGTMFRKRHNEIYSAAVRRGAIQIVSNLELTQYGEELKYLENPVPFVRYNKMRRAWKKESGLAGASPYRIVHSPTSRGNKGTAVFLKAVENLKKEGHQIEVIMIERKSHKEALAMKVKADACFDSFWLGLQVSGLESACFEQPVLAGDELIRDKMIELYGYCPYTFVTEDTLQDEIRKFIIDRSYREQEQKRVTDHVRRYHDYGPVAKKYMKIIDRELKIKN